MDNDPMNSGIMETAPPRSLEMTLDQIAPAFMQPSRLSQPYAWIEHIPFAFWVVAQHQPRVLVELGTHTGNSYLAFCQAIASLGLPTRAFAVDTWKGDEHAGLYGEEIYETLSLYHDQHYTTFSRLVRSTFDNALKHFSDRSIDLLHIDGLHTYEAVAHDYSSWISKVSDRGILLMHDTNVRENNFGVFRLWEEIRSQFPHFEFFHGHGLGVLGLGPSVGAQMKALFAARLKNEACHQIQQTFAQLGRALTVQVDLNEERKQRLSALSHQQFLKRRWNEMAARNRILEDRLQSEQLQVLKSHQDEIAARIQALGDRLQSEMATSVRAAEDKVRDAMTQHVQTHENQVRLERVATELQAKLASVRDATRRSPLSLVKVQLARLVRKAWVQAGRGAWRRAAFLLASCMLKAAVPNLHRKLRRVVTDPRVLFDRDWYVDQYSEIGASGVDPYMHYVHIGADRGYDPNPLFDSDWYLAQYPDVAAAGKNPLIHYFHDGATQGYDPNPYFDTDWYVAQNIDVIPSGMNPLLHYIRVGAATGRNPSPAFDSSWYLAEYPDVANTGMNPLVHFVLFGASEGRSPRDTAAVHLPVPKFFRLGPRDRLGHMTTHRDGKLSDTHSVAIDKILTARGPGPAAANGLAVDVIVPIYRGFAETRRCVESVLRSRPLNRAFGRLILINDNSPDLEISAYLSDLTYQDGVLLLANASNMGFVASVNRGMSAADRNDVILLNSDTEVCGNWLDRLVAHAYTHARIATVTPFSNNATICSYPDIGGKTDLPGGLPTEQIDLACMEANAGRAVEIPTGVGFCMLVTRNCLDEIGGFDEEAFGKGYGEEVDFCQRALARGWRHLLAGDVFVFHDGEISFADSSNERKAKAAALLRQRHPTFEPQVARWVEKDPALPLRLATTAALWKRSGKPIVLHLLHAAGGGTEKHVAELTDSLAGSARHLVLLVRKDQERFGFALLISEEGSRRIVEFTAAKIIDIIPFLQSFGISQAHVHHALEIPTQVLSFLKHLDVPYDLSIHDYTTICPRINMMKEEAYCGEPDEMGCLRCLSADGNKLSSDILWWRNLGSSMIKDADRVLCPSVDAAERVRRYVPSARIIVVPHENELYRPGRALTPRALTAGQPLDVAVLGVMTAHKGGAYLLDCIEAAVQRRAQISWHVIGEFDPLLKSQVDALSNSLSVSGRYEIEDLHGLIERVAPHLLLFPQRWPETYSYTLSEAFAAGVPVLAPDIGAFTERTEGIPWCWTYPLHLPPAELVVKLLDIRKQFECGQPNAPAPRTSTDATSFTIETDFYRERYLRKTA
jgi:GT2 family glycosyltransferase/glycosyltransferase involved in cell wall biosynthesis